MKKLLISFLLIICSLSVWSKDVRKTSFRQLYQDTDKNCPTWNIERFKSIKQLFYVGVETATKYGFDYAVPVERNGVDQIWCVLEKERGVKNKACSTKLFEKKDRPFYFYEKSRPDTNKESDFYTSKFANKEEQFMAYLSYVRKVYDEQGVKESNTGSVLEVLARMYLQEVLDIYPVEKYAITSGIEYSYDNQRTLGELDIVVYDRDTCQVVALGEAKAANSRNQGNALMKAKDQLRRVKDFIDSN